MLSNFNPQRPTKMVAHGWNGSPETFKGTRFGILHMTALRAAPQLYFYGHVLTVTEFLAHEDCNFIAIDWTELGTGVDYPLILYRGVPKAALETGYYFSFYDFYG